MSGEMDARSKPPPAERDTLSSLYKVGSVLGKGGFAEVRHAIDRRTGEEVAVKIVKVVEGPGGRKIANLVKQEISILRKVKHGNIMGLREVFSQGNTYFIVTELCSGGELLTEMLDSKGYSEEECKEVLLGLCNGVEYLHDRGIVHRDLKLENILLAKKGDRTAVKIADFGLAAKTAGRRLQSMTGSMLFVAPEIIRCRDREGVWYDERVDVWSMGVCLYILLSGRPPFDHPNPEKHFKLIMKGEFGFPRRDFVGVSKEAMDLVTKMLRTDPSDRITLHEMFRHPWLASLSRDRSKQPHAMLVRSQESLRRLSEPGREHSDVVEDDGEAGRRGSVGMPAVAGAGRTRFNQVTGQGGQPPVVGSIDNRTSDEVNGPGPAGRMFAPHMLRSEFKAPPSPLSRRTSNSESPFGPGPSGSACPGLGDRPVPPGTSRDSPLGPSPQPSPMPSPNHYMASPLSPLDPTPFGGLSIRTKPKEGALARVWGAERTSPESPSLGDATPRGATTKFNSAVSKLKHKLSSSRRTVSCDVGALLDALPPEASPPPVEAN